MTYQQKLISDHINHIIDNRGLNISGPETVEDMVKANIHKLNYGDNVAIDIVDDEVLSIQKLDGFNQTFNIGYDSLILTYEQLESIFYEQNKYV